MIHFFLLGFLLTAPLSASAPYREIQDLSRLPLLNPDLKERKIGKIVLSNGLEVLLVSDPQADQSSASMAVGTGSWNDPVEYPGMAHFCEHMLFMGSQKYPDCNEFFRSVADVGGHTNAFTAADRTVYMFSAKTEGFVDCLDRFSRFFIDPLFHPSFVSRELHAVDQEFSKSLEHDGWRTFMVFKELLHEDHPHTKFSCGNSLTLSKIPSEALKTWHGNEYKAEKMHLFVYSSLPLETLKKTVATQFASVPRGTSSIEVPKAPLLSSKRKGQIAYIEPIQQRQSLALYWEIPAEIASHPSQPAQLLAYALNRGDPHSLYETLQRQGWIDRFQASVDDMGVPNERLFALELELTTKGMEEMDKVVLSCFETLASLQQGELPSYLFDEMNRVRALGYQYQNRQDPFAMAEEVGRTLPEEPLATYPREEVIASEYSPLKVKELLGTLSPNASLLLVTAPSKVTGITPDRKERWFEVNYAVRPIPIEWLQLWNQVKPRGDFAFASPNPFLPTRFDAAPSLEAANLAPTLLSKGEAGVAYYYRALEFAAPSSSIQLHIHSPQIDSSAKSAVLASLYLDHLTDLLHPTLAAATAAGLKAHFDLHQLALRLQIDGFNDKAPLLLQQILEQMPKNPPTKEQFQIYYDRHEKSYANGDKLLPLQQAQEELYHLLSTGAPTAQEKLEALQAINYETFGQFYQELFAQTYASALFAGNLSLKEAQSSWIDVQHALSRGVYAPSAHPQVKVLALPPQGGPFAIHRSTEAQGNATLLAIDQGALTFERRGVQEVLGTLLREEFFNELRTKQQTGYIARAIPIEIEERCFELFMVQSNSHQPEDLLHRFELFLEEFVHTLPEQLSAERFETLKGAAIHSLKTKFRNLKEKTALFDLLLFEKGGDLQYIEKRIHALTVLTKEQFIEIATQMLSRKNHQRIAILFEGTLPDPFAYSPIAPEKLAEISQYLPKKVDL